MGRGDNGKKVASNADDRTIRRQAEEFNTWLERMERMDEDELREYAKKNKETFCSQKRAAIKKLLQKDKPKKRRRRTVLSPILGAVLKFHKDDDDANPAPAPAPAGENAA